MFADPTAFILGAGASWHYGYPTGEQLVKKIIERANNLQKYLEFSVRTQHGNIPAYIAEMEKPTASIQDKWQSALDDCTALKTRLEQVNPLVIDYFLGWNPKLKSVGRLLIAWVILECEYRYEQNRSNLNRREALLDSPLESDRIRANNISLQKYKDNWCRFVIHQIAINCKISSDILKNTVHFVTFNYDISLERALSSGLSHIELFQHDDIEKFLTNGRVVHAYGKVRENPFERPPQLAWLNQALNTERVSVQQLVEYEDFLNQIYYASRGIRVIDPDDKGADQGAIDAAVSAIRNAAHVYILGYGFDENNSARLNLQESLRAVKPTSQSVSFTNFGNSNRINKRASKVFFRDEAHFSSEMPQVASFNQSRYEKSHRDVYEALELDFYLPSRQ
jgi:hypothetical protein